MLFLTPNQQCQSTEGICSPEKSGLINPLHVCMTSDEHSGAEACQLHMVLADLPPLPFPQIDITEQWCLEGKRESYQVCSVYILCTTIVHSAMNRHINRPNSLWIGFCLTGPISLCLDSFLYTYYCMHVQDCNMVRRTWWD